jgi:hypothetical protein
MALLSFINQSIKSRKTWIGLGTVLLTDMKL